MTSPTSPPPARRRSIGRAGTDPLSRVLVLVLLLLTAACFGWPFLIDSPAALAAGNDLPWLFPVVLTLLAATLLAQLTRGGMEAKQVATLGTLISLGAALRVLAAGTSGVEPMFSVIIIAGRVLGPSGGMLVGAGSVLTGAFLTAGVGPWLPFQMLACAGVGALAGCLPACGPRAERWLLAGYALIAGLGFGAVMNLWFWPFLGDGAPAGADFRAGDSLPEQLAHYGSFYVLTSLGWDLVRGVLNAVLVVIAGPRLIAVLRRAVRRAGFDAQGSFAPGRDGNSVAATMTPGRAQSPAQEDS
ncbi:ECF transporter S component [Dermacoccaceae bacterium W4C1]